MSSKPTAEGTPFWKIQAIAWGAFSSLTFVFHGPVEGTGPGLTSLLLRLTLILFFILLFRPLCHLVWRRRASFVPLIAGLIAGAMLMALADEWIVESFTHMVCGRPHTVIFRATLTASLRYQLLYCAWCVCYFGVKFLHQTERQRELMRRARRMRVEGITASFRYRLPSGFLNEILRGISRAIMEEERGRASLMIARFGDLLARILEHPERHFAALSEEIAHAEEYLVLQRMLHRHDLLMEIDVADRLGNSLIPRWFLVPLLDEIYREGRATQADASIRLTIKRAASRLRLDLSWMIDARTEDPSVRIPRFDSIRSLLNLVYGECALFECSIGVYGALRIELPLDGTDIDHDGQAMAKEVPEI